MYLIVNFAASRYVTAVMALQSRVPLCTQKSYKCLVAFVTARKRSLGQGNMFTGVSVHRGCMLPGGAWSGGVGGSLVRGGALWRPPGRLLLRAVCILLECILVYFKNTCRKLLIISLLKVRLNFFVLSKLTRVPVVWWHMQYVEHCDISDSTRRKYGQYKKN